MYKRQDHTLCRSLPHADRTKARAYIGQKLGELDQARIAKGQEALMLNLSLDQLRRSIDRVFTTCRDKPNVTVSAATHATYIMVQKFGPE